MQYRGSTGIISKIKLILLNIDCHGSTFMNIVGICLFVT